jgi:hypothetical protein
MNQPESSAKYNDLIDMAIQACSKTIQRKSKDGSIEYDQVIDDKTVWFKTLLVNSNNFSRLALYLMEWIRMGERAQYNMPNERAVQYANEIADIGVSFMRAIDAKSSETQRDERNSQSSLMHLINRDKIERVYTTKGDAQKQGVLDAILGRDKERDMEYD